MALLIMRNKMLPAGLLAPFKAWRRYQQRVSERKARGVCTACGERPAEAAIEMCGQCWNEQAAAP